jgi:hypothetical protein
MLPQSLPKHTPADKDKVENATLCSETAKVENNEVKFDLDELRAKFPSIFEKSQMSKEDLKHVLSEMLVKSFSGTPDSKKAKVLTGKESQRELNMLCKSIDDNFQEDSIDVTALMSFIQKLQWSESLDYNKPTNKLVASENIISLKHLLGIIHFEDLREYTSTVEVYRITGYKEKQNYPPVINWRQGKVCIVFSDLCSNIPLL